MPSAVLDRSHCCEISYKQSPDAFYSVKFMGGNTDCIDTVVIQVRLADRLSRINMEMNFWIVFKHPGNFFYRLDAADNVIQRQHFDESNKHNQHRFTINQ